MFKCFSNDTLCSSPMKMKSIGCGLGRTLLSPVFQYSEHTLTPPQHCSSKPRRQSACYHGMHYSQDFFHQMHFLSITYLLLLEICSQWYSETSESNGLQVQCFPSSILLTHTCSFQLNAFDTIILHLTHLEGSIQNTMPEMHRLY